MLNRTRLRTAAICLGLLVVVALVWWAASAIDLAGTVSNLLADVLIVATTSVAVQWRRRRRQRQSLHGELVKALTSARELLADIDTEVRNVCEWSTNRSPDASDVDGPWRLLHHRPYVQPSTEHGSPWLRLYASLEGLAAHHGMFDMSSLLLPSEATHRRMYGHLTLAVNALASPQADGSRSLRLVVLAPQQSQEDATINYDPAAVETAMRQLHSTAVELRDALIPLRDAVESIDPVRSAAQRVPDALPRPITVGAIVLAVIAAVAWLGSYAYSRAHPDARSFTEGLTDNVLAGIIVVVVGLLVAKIVLQREWERRIRRSSQLAVKVSITALQVASIVNCPDSVLRAEQLSAVADFMGDCVGSLQHVRADADLQGLVHIFAKRARRCLADGANTAHFDSPPCEMAGVMTLYVPTPIGNRLVELAGDIQAQVAEIYLKRR